MRYEFIVEGPVSDVDASELPESTSTTDPTGGTSLFGPIQDEADVDVRSAAHVKCCERQLREC